MNRKGISCGLTVCALAVLAGSWVEGAQAKGGFERVFSATDTRLDRAQLRVTISSLSGSWMQDVLRDAGKGRDYTKAVRRGNLEVVDDAIVAQQARPRMEALSLGSDPEAQARMDFGEKVIVHFTEQEKQLRGQRYAPKGGKVGINLLSYIEGRAVKDKYKQIGLLEWPSVFNDPNQPKDRQTAQLQLSDQTASADNNQFPTPPSDQSQVMKNAFQQYYQPSAPLMTNSMYEVPPSAPPFSVYEGGKHLYPNLDEPTSSQVTQQGQPGTVTGRFQSKRDRLALAGGVGVVLLGTGAIVGTVGYLNCHHADSSC